MKDIKGWARHEKQKMKKTKGGVKGKGGKGAGERERKGKHWSRRASCAPNFDPYLRCCPLQWELSF